MKRILITLVVVCGCADVVPILDGDVTYTVHPDDAEIAEWVSEAIDHWQPAVPYRLTVQIGGLQGDGYLVRRVDEFEVGPWFEAPPKNAVGITLPGTDGASREIQIKRSAGSWTRETIEHEIGHSVGARHADYCGRGVMAKSADIRGRDVSACELDAVARRYSDE